MKYLVQPLFTNNQSQPGVVPGKGYRILAGNNPGALIPPMIKVDGGGYLVTAAPADDPTCEFRLEALAGDALGYYRVHHLATGKYLTVPNASKSAGAKLQVQPFGNAQHQQFKIILRSDGKVDLVARHSDMVVTIKGASTALGASIVQESWSAGAHQRWFVVPTFETEGRPMVLANVYHGRVLREVNGRPQLDGWHEATAEQWLIEPLTGSQVGYFRVINVHSGKAITLEKGPYGYGPPTYMAPWSNGVNQRFLLIDQSGGRGTLVSAANLKALVPLNETSLYEQEIANDPEQLWQIGLVKPSSVSASLQAEFFEHFDYQGTSRSLGPGFWNMSEIGLANDTLSSIKIPAGLRVTLYEHQDFAGAKRIFEANAPQIVEFNDKTSSILVELVATIYTDRDFGGAKQTIGVGRYKTANLTIGDNALSSMRIPPGLLVTLFESDNYSGRGWNYVEDTKWTGALDNKVSSILVEQIGIAVPRGVVRYGGTIALKSHLKKYLCRGAGTSVRADGGAPMQLTVIRAAGSKYKSMLAYGDRIRLRDANNLYLTATASNDATLSAELSGDAGKAQIFRVVRASGTRHNDLVAEGDVLALRAASNDRYLVGETSGDANINRTNLGSYEKWVLEAVTQPPGTSPTAGVSVCAAEACGADACAAAACGAATAIVGICGVAATAIGVCAADVCGAAGCAAAACGGDACVGAVAVFTACGADVCATDLCGIAACGAAASGVGVCGSDLCGAAACGAAVTAVGMSLVNACGSALGGISACPIDVCGANACGINMCPIDACGADACGLDIAPIVPGI